MVLAAAKADDDEGSAVEMFMAAGAYMFRALEPPQYSFEFPEHVIVQAELPGTEPA